MQRISMSAKSISFGALFLILLLVYQNCSQGIHLQNSKFSDHMISSLNKAAGTYSSQPGATYFPTLNSQSPTPAEFVGKSFVGYQAWFNTPHDGYSRGWNHWGRSEPLSASTMTVDMWPDLSEYPAETIEATGFTLGNGQPAKTFSSSHQDVINLHFKWMKEYGIDGAFLQWFVSEPTDYRLQIAKKVSQAANSNGRQF